MGNNTGIAFCNDGPGAQKFASVLSCIAGLIGTQPPGNVTRGSVQTFPGDLRVKMYGI
jgi:hypothetical protein